MNLPPLLELRELPEEVRELILEQLVQEAPPDLCGRLFERCLLLLGSGNCGADNPIWKLACERFGLRRMVRADWRATFQNLCEELSLLRQREYEARQRDVGPHTSVRMGENALALQTFFAHLRGDGAEFDLGQVHHAFRVFYSYVFPILKEALSGLGAIDTFDPYHEIALMNALHRGDVDAVKAAIGTGIHPGGLELFTEVKRMESQAISVSQYWDEAEVAEYRADQQRPILERIRLLLRAGASPNGVVNGFTAFTRAVANFEDPLETHNEAFRLLLEGGAEPNYGAYWGTPLVRLLHRMTGRQVLNEQKKIEFLERLRLLLEAGADPNAAHRFGTPMALLRSWRSWAREDARQEAEELLKAFGARDDLD